MLKVMELPAKYVSCVIEVVSQAILLCGLLREV